MTHSLAGHRPPTPGEELANALSHGLGCLAAISCLPVMVWFAGVHGSACHVVAAMALFD